MYDTHILSKYLADSSQLYVHTQLKWIIPLSELSPGFLQELEALQKSLSALRIQPPFVCPGKVGEQESEQES